MNETTTEGEAERTATSLADPRDAALAKAREALEAARDANKDAMLSLLSRNDRAGLLLTDRIHRADSKAREALAAFATLDAAKGTE